MHMIFLLFFWVYFSMVVRHIGYRGGGDGIIGHAKRIWSVGGVTDQLPLLKLTIVSVR